MKPSTPAARHPHDALAKLVRTVLGTAVTSVEADTYGATNAVYYVQLEGGAECVLRVSPASAREQVAAQVWALEECARRCVPVPRLLAHDVGGERVPDPFLVMERLRGVVAPRAGLDAVASRALFVELGRQLAAIHSVRVAGFGPLVHSGGGFRGRYGTLWEAIRAELRGWVSALGPVLPPALAEEIGRSLEAAAGRGLFAADQAVLVHRDFQLRNVLVADGGLSGVLDFDKAEAGDPARDFAVLYPGDVVLVREGYEAVSPGALGERFAEKLIAYRLLGALERLWHDEVAGRTEPREQTLHSAERLMAALSGAGGSKNA